MKNQDTIKVRVKGNDPDKVVSDMNRMIELIRDSAQSAREVGNE